jgi:hypothetical protein
MLRTYSTRTIQIDLDGAFHLMFRGKFKSRFVLFLLDMLDFSRHWALDENRQNSKWAAEAPSSRAQQSTVEHSRAQQSTVEHSFGVVS